jgi:hypothetical protein
MKRPWILLFGGLLLGIAAYACVYLAGTSQERSVARSEEPALAWMRHEFNLDDAQFRRLNELHDAYLPRCAEMCRRIDQKNSELQQLLSKTNVVTPEIKSALADAAQLRAECQANMLDHFYAVSKTMPAEQGEKYLAWIKRETFKPAHMMPAPASEAGASHHMR